MNIILLRADDWLDAELAMVSDHRATHIRTVLKAQVGDALHVGLLGVECGTGVIESLDLSSVRLRVQLSDPPPPRHRFDLVMALPRPKMLRRILRQCAEFGVEHLHLINSARVEKSFWQSPLLRPSKVGKPCKQGWSAPQAAGVIHTDFQRGFIKAEIVSFGDLVATGSMAEAKAKGKVRMEGKDYVMQDGDVVEFRFNV